jgi:hypothetical protein
LALGSKDGLLIYKGMEAIQVSEHMKQFGAVRAGQVRAAEALALRLKNTADAEVNVRFWQSGRRVFEFLCPLMSDPTRYVVFSKKNWSYFVSNSRMEIPDSVTLGVTEAQGCEGIALAARKEERHIQFYRSGRAIRQIECFYDARWDYIQMGRRLPFEMPKEEIPRRIQDRLTPERVAAYFEAFTGQTFPDWHELSQGPVRALEVSYKSFEFTPRRYRTRNDLLP